MLRAGDAAIAAGIVLRHQGRAVFFKLGVDERFAKYSPGVQLTLDLTRHLCADPAIASADSTAGPDHPMINPIWRGRFAIGDVLIPLYARAVETRRQGGLIHDPLFMRAPGGWIWMAQGAFNTTSLDGEPFREWLTREESRHKTLMQEAGFLAQPQ